MKYFPSKDKIVAYLLNMNDIIDEVFILSNDNIGKIKIPQQKITKPLLNLKTLFKS